MTRAERLADYDRRAKAGDHQARRLAEAMRIGEPRGEVREFEPPSPKPTPDENWDV